MTEGQRQLDKLNLLLTAIETFYAFVGASVRIYNTDTEI